LDDNHVLDPDRTAVLKRFVASDDAAVLVDQDRAPGAELTERILNHLLAVFCALVRIALIGQEVFRFAMWRPFYACDIIDRAGCAQQLGFGGRNKAVTPGVRICGLILDLDPAHLKSNLRSTVL
jgi:hypothetical protein